MRQLLALIFFLAVTAARAGNPGPCPSFHAGWALSGPGPITGILWDQYTKQMYFVWVNQPMPTPVVCLLADENGIQMLATETTSLILSTETNLCSISIPLTFVDDYYPVASSSVMQTFRQSKNWEQTFATLIAPSYEAVLLQEINNCPVLQENFSFPCALEDETSNPTEILLSTETKVILFTENPVCTTTPGSFVWVN